MTENFDESLLHDFADQSGVSIYDHSCTAPLLLILLRHVGCTFCRRSLDELRASRDHIADCGYSVGIVHMNRDEKVVEQLASYGLEDLPRFYDPGKVLYAGLGLKRVPLRSLFVPTLIREGFKNHLKFGSSWPEADPQQLPGAFLIDQGRVVGGETVLFPYDQPDFLTLLIYAETLVGKTSKGGSCQGSRPRRK